MRIKKLDEFELNERRTEPGPDKNKVASYKRKKTPKERALDFYRAGKLAEQTSKNYKEAHKELTAALQHIKAAYEGLQRMPVVGWGEEIPDLLRELENILFTEDFSGERWENYLKSLESKAR